jgi:hypothetical protein
VVFPKLTVPRKNPVTYTLPLASAAVALIIDSDEFAVACEADIAICQGGTCAQVSIAVRKKSKMAASELDKRHFSLRLEESVITELIRKMNNN